VFNRHKAAIAGKHAITEEQVRQAAEVGSKLQTLVRDNKAVRERKTPQAVLDQVEIRNRFWTLLNARHDKLWRVGAWLAGRDRADEMVPPLQSRQAAPRAQAVAAAGGESTEPPSVPSPKK
jgi:hypothetical protein